MCSGRPWKDIKRCHVLCWTNTDVQDDEKDFFFLMCLKHMSLVPRSMMSVFMLTLCLLSFVNFYLITSLPSNAVA